uniref:RecQ mediated genome instability protein 1 N-terminal domain-containing protein n=1 Tax=Panagrolaimus sp. JU765 TaxID=591449 RepID=A0AC34RSD9_9BILA
MTGFKADGWQIDEVKLEETLGDDFDPQITESELVKLLIDLDIKDYGKAVLNEKLSKAKVLSGPLILQLSKWRNVSYPNVADHEDNNGVHVCHLYDGSRTVKAMATEPISKLDGNTVYGTKVLLTDEIKIENNILQLSNKNTKILGGTVEKRIDEWRAEKLGNKENRKNAVSGAPKWIPFEKRFLVKNVATDNNFKSMNLLKESKKDDEKEDTVFDMARKAEIENLKMMKKSLNLPQLNEEVRKEILPEKNEKREVREPKEKRQMNSERTQQKTVSNQGGRGRGRRGREIETNEYSRPTTTGTLFDYLQASTGITLPLETRQDPNPNLNSQFSQLNVGSSQQSQQPIISTNYRGRGRGQRGGDQTNRGGQRNNDQHGNGSGRSRGRGRGGHNTGFSSANQETVNSTSNRGKPSSTRVFYSSSRGRGRPRG